MKNDTSNISSVRRRLFVLLLRSFIVVVVFLVIFIIFGASYVLIYDNENNPYGGFRIGPRLETYYRAMGTWEGIDQVFDDELSREDQVVWETSILIGADERIIAYKGDVEAEEVGELYDDWRNGRVFTIEMHGEAVGYLALPRSSLGERYELALPILAPVGFVSVFLALLTIVIGLLLVRSVVNPLAEVISASGKVAKGDLSARVTVSGPDDMRVLSDSFNQMAGELERNDRERREFLAVIAHELRTPLTVIRGRLEGIVDGIYPPDGTQISPALEETYLLERLVEDLRLLTLTETRQLQFVLRTISLGKLAEHAIGIFSAEAAEKGISLSLINNAPNIEVEVDPQRTEQVIGNLISNALRYVPEGGEVKVLVEESDNSVCLHVS
jgi:signal transduction histidine kinase